MENKKFTNEEDQLIRKTFSYGASIKEVCLETGFSYDRIMEWTALDNNAKEVELLQLSPKWKAKKKLVDTIDDDVKNAQWFAERKIKDEFSLRSELTGKDGTALIPPHVSLD